MRASASEYCLSNGRAAVFSEPNALTKHEWLVVAETWVADKASAKSGSTWRVTSILPCLMTSWLTL